MRILYSMLHVANLEATLKFYTHTLNTRLLRRRNYPDGRFTLAFVGYQDECATTTLESTHNQDQDGRTQNDGYGHLAIEVGDVTVTCARVRALGYRVTREAGPVQRGRSVITFLENPDGYRMELVQKGTQFG